MMPDVRLRPWTDADLDPFAALSADPEVMRYFPSTLSREQAGEVMQRFREGVDRRGWGFWAVEVDGEFAGLTGLAEPRFEAHFTPCVEIGWRFARKFWGRGLAFAAARQAEDYAFSVLKLDALVSFTAVTNTPSRRLMDRLGFRYDPAGDFQHPNVPENHPLRPHVLYRKGRQRIFPCPEAGEAGP